MNKHKLYNEANEFGVAHGFAIKVRHFSRIEDILDTPQQRRLYSRFREMLEAQFDIDVNALLRGVDLTAVDEQQLNALVTNAMTPSTDALDYDGTLELLTFFANEGVANGLDDVPADTTERQRIQANANAANFARERLNSLLGINPPGATVTERIDNPYLQNGIDIATATAIAGLLGVIIREAVNEGDTRKKEIARRYDDSKGERVDSRARLLSENNSTVVYSNGTLSASRVFNPIAKTWLRTRSRMPRAQHLAQVGVTVPFEARFPTGEYWSQELIECKCGILVTYPAEILESGAVGTQQAQPRLPFGGGI